MSFEELKDAVKKQLCFPSNARRLPHLAKTPRHYSPYMSCMIDGYWLRWRNFDHRGGASGLTVSPAFLSACGSTDLADSVDKEVCVRQRCSPCRILFDGSIISKTMGKWKRMLKATAAFMATTLTMCGRFCVLRFWRNHPISNGLKLLAPGIVSGGFMSPRRKWWHFLTAGWKELLADGYVQGQDQMWKADRCKPPLPPAVHSWWLQKGSEHENFETSFCI